VVERRCKLLRRSAKFLTEQHARNPKLKAFALSAEMSNISPRAKRQSNRFYSISHSRAARHHGGQVLRRGAFPIERGDYQLIAEAMQVFGESH